MCGEVNATGSVEIRNGISASHAPGEGRRADAPFRLGTLQHDYMKQKDS